MTTYGAVALKERNDEINEWLEAKKAAAHWAAEENRLRLAVIARNFGEEHKAEGTENVALDDKGYGLKAVFKLNYSLDNKGDAVDKALTKLEKSGDEGKFLADRLVKWKPELSLSEWRNLPEKYQKLFDDVLTVKPGTPSLEFVVPKEEK